MVVRRHCGEANLWEEEEEEERERERERKGDERELEESRNRFCSARSLNAIPSPPLPVGHDCFISPLPNNQAAEETKLVKERHIAFLAPVHHKTKISPCFFFFKLV